MAEAAPFAAIVELDLRGLKCPLPVLHTRRALRRLAAGQMLRVACTDPMASIDIPHLVQEDGHRLIEATRNGDVASFVIRKGGNASASGSG